jgi:hypothetical protein
LVRNSHNNNDNGIMNNDKEISNHSSRIVESDRF